MRPTLDDLAGLWRAERRIEDRLGPGGAFAGTYAFAPDGAGLSCTEAGMLALDGRPALQATRVTLWRRAAGGIAVSFADGRPFHRVGPDAAHVCPPDLYRAAYDFSRWPEWSVTWRATGPAKDWTAVTRLTRLA